MVHGALTLLMRSLRRDARLRRAHAFRIACVLFLAGMLIVAHVMSFTVGAPGLRFFRSICYLNFALVTLAGFSFFSSAITEEKEEGTLGLLKLADLSTVSILLGKSTNRLFSALLVCAAQFPFALLAMTLGGVTVHQVWSAYVALAAYMVLVANVALLCSVISRRSGTASILMLFLSLFFLAAVPLMWSGKSRFAEFGFVQQSSGLVLLFWDGIRFLNDASILARLDEILTTGFHRSAFGVQVLGSLLGALASFAVAWIVFDRFTEYVDSRPRRGLVLRPSSRRLFRMVRPWRCALIWKDFHFVAGGPVLAGVKLVLYPALVIGLWQLSQYWIGPVFGLRFTDAVWLLAVTATAAELLLYATRIFHQERQWGTLPTLVVLPRSTMSLAYGKLCGCLLGSLPTLLLIVLLASIVPPPLAQGNPLLDVRFVILLGAFVVVLHLTALYSLILRWGALPLAIATLLVLGTCLGVPILTMALAALRHAGQSDYANLGPILYTAGIASAVLQFLIGIRIRAAAA